MLLQSGSEELILLTRCVLFLAALAAAAAEAPFTVAGLGDGEKITKSGAVPPSPLVWDAHTGILRIDGGRNEVLGAPKPAT